jgi:hypothetical protein
MDDDDFLTSDASFFPCDLTEGDYLEVHRIGMPGVDGSVVSLSTVVEDLQEMELKTHLAYVGSIMLTPQIARMLAVSLIELADEADGIETSFFPVDQVEEATDGNA